jgi:hypothetical protein
MAIKMPPDDAIILIGKLDVLCVQHLIEERGRNGKLIDWRYMEVGRHQSQSECNVSRPSR